MGMNFSKLKDYLDRQNKDGTEVAEVDPDKYKQFIAGSGGVFQPQQPPTPEETDEEKRKKGLY